MGTQWWEHPFFYWLQNLFDPDVGWTHIGTEADRP